MSDQPTVLISDSRHASAFHVELGNSRLAACGKNAQHDVAFDRVTLTEAIEEHNREPCTSCPIPNAWAEAARPAHQQKTKLRAAYEEAGSIAGAAEHFDASYCTVRNWLIEHGIHEPRTYDEVWTGVDQLDKLDDLPALEERKTEGSA